MADKEILIDALERLSAGLRTLKGIGDIAASADRQEILFDEWDWEIGVGLYGRLRDASARNDTLSLAAMERWYDRQIDRGLPDRQINSTAPMLAMALLARVRARSDWLPLIEDWAQWLMNGLPKTAEGGFEHTVKEGRNEGQLWDDTLVMAVLFLAVAGRYGGRDDWLAEAHYQFLCHIRFLGDRRSGLFVHGWTFQGHHNYANALWARGNGWLAIAIPELFALAPPKDPAIARYLREVYRTQLQSLQALQGRDGMFHTLLDDPTSPPEASATAAIGYGILAGMRENLIGPEFEVSANAALDAVLARIDEDGLLREVSDGTPMGNDLDFYRKIRNIATPYGQSLATLLLTEALSRTETPISST